MKATTLLCLTLLISCASHSNDLPPNVISMQFQDQLAGELKKSHADFQISKIYSRQDNSKAFLTEQFGADLLLRAISTSQDDYYFKPLEKELASHIGIATITYLDGKAAKSQFKKLEKEGFFQASKILTRFIASLSGNAIIVIYSESAANKEVSDHMATLSYKYSNSKN